MCLKISTANFSLSVVACHMKANKFPCESRLLGNRNRGLVCPFVRREGFHLKLNWERTLVEIETSYHDLKQQLKLAEN